MPISTVTKQVCSIADIRRTVGISKDTIEDDDVSRIIYEAQEVAGEELNSSIYPKTVIEAHDGNRLGTAGSILFVNKTPVLNVLAVRVDTDDVSPEYVKIYPGGKIVLTDDAEETKWDTSEPQGNKIKYTYGLTVDGSHSTTTSAAITTPATGTSISVTSSAGFVAGDYFRIYGMDGYSEVTTVTSVTDGTTIVADIYFPHESGSIVVIQEVPQKIKRFVELITSLMMVARIVGESYTDIVGYTIESLAVQKGEPYTQWRETALQFQKEKDNMKATYLRPQPVVVV
jgi:hypothetical protein